MTETPRRGSGEEPQAYGYPGYTDPAYASQAYGPTYQPPVIPAPTRQLPTYPGGYDPYGTGQYYATGQYGQPPYPPGGEPPPEPEKPKSPRWLWALAGIAALTVVGLVIALVIVNSSKQETLVAPPPMDEPSFSTPPTSRTPTTVPRPTVPPSTRPSVPRQPGVPAPTYPTSPRTTQPGVTQTVVYVVNGTGRAINITYVDTGGLLQTEFNVLLPWRKEVQLAEPASSTASISIINVGREVNCSITVDGTVVEQRTGAGLTICTGIR
ncbi:mycobacterium membrane protein [Mycolicibacterium phlei]|jgi:hypothetical protein|nr:MmpS family transport accessory protein [Mycolicibacterium phlei]AMO62470.1 Membrane protein [Mycolicibacterium phlei]KXW77659.1 membrane protein [Mycolicibacterium phlei DSM 43071]STZ20803.1 mycobacterium membrane protein [Mycolicibacterium phlei]VEG10571.1 mycobacterium membrane protein [Mycobacteroides chelonae]